MKKIGMACLLAAFLLSASGAVQAAEKWDMALIGRMDVPKSVSIEAGEQMALPFTETNSPKMTLARMGMPDGHFYTITRKDGPNFTYGWAASAVIGAQYLQREGAKGYRNLSLSEQLDVIAETLNKQIIAQEAVFDGKTPLVKMSDKKHPRWEGSFIIEKKSEGISYRTKYFVTVQQNEIRIVFGILSADADAPELTKALGEMLAKRKFLKETDWQDLQTIKSAESEK